jgi:flagellar basal body-associated protein FliL
MNNSESDGQESKRRTKVMIPVAMMFVAIGMMFVVLFSVSSRSHDGAGLGIFGPGTLGHGMLIGVGIAFEIVGLVLAVSAAVAAKKN